MQIKLYGDDVNCDDAGWLALSSVYILHEQKYFLIEFSICGAAIKTFFLFTVQSHKNHTLNEDWMKNRQREREWKNIVNVMRFAIIVSA